MGVNATKSNKTESLTLKKDGASQGVSMLLGSFWGQSALHHIPDRNVDDSTQSGRQTCSVAAAAAPGEAAARTR